MEDIDKDLDELLYDFDVADANKEQLMDAFIDLWSRGQEIRVNGYKDQPYKDVLKLLHWMSYKSDLIKKELVSRKRAPFKHCVECGNLTVKNNVSGSLCEKCTVRDPNTNSETDESNFESDETESESDETNSESDETNSEAVEINRIKSIRLTRRKLRRKPIK